MPTDHAEPNRHIVSIKTAHFAGLIAGDHASGQIDVTVRTAGGPTLVSMSDQEIEIPMGSPFLDGLLSAAMIGTVIYLTREGRRIAAVVPADIAESLLNDPLGEEENGDPAPGGGAGRRRLQQLIREQGVRPVEDPAELRGAEMVDFDEFFSAAMSARLR
jgi:hypothetical protein